MWITLSFPRFSGDSITRTISGRVAELGLALDPAAAPAANYVPFVQ